jgi:hypothetical protein
MNIEKRTSNLLEYLSKLEDLQRINPTKNLSSRMDRVCDELEKLLLEKKNVLSPINVNVPPVTPNLEIRKIINSINNASKKLNANV